jgi:hypothetical protein
MAACSRKDQNVLLYTMIVNIMEEIERYGHYAFRNDEKKASQFTFEYKPVSCKTKKLKLRQL